MNKVLLFALLSASWHFSLHFFCSSSPFYICKMVGYSWGVLHFLRYSTIITSKTLSSRDNIFLFPHRHNNFSVKYLVDVLTATSTSNSTHLVLKYTLKCNFAVASKISRTRSKRFMESTERTHKNWQERKKLWNTWIFAVLHLFTIISLNEFRLLSDGNVL